MDERLPKSKVSFDNVIYFNDGTHTTIKERHAKARPLRFDEMEQLEQIRPDLPYASLNMHRGRHLPVVKHFTIHNQLNYLVNVWFLQRVIQFHNTFVVFRFL